MMRRTHTGARVGSVLVALLSCAFALALAASCSKDSSTGPGLLDGGIAGGQCDFCGEDQECCNGICVDTQENANHCGACGNACSDETADSCQYGLCRCRTGAECTGGKACCDTGCADTQSDELNCGGCGIECGEGEECVAGSCICAGEGGLCVSGDTCCGDGCVDLQANDANCGACGAPCAEGTVCSGGECACQFECPADTLLEGCCGDGCYDLCSDPQNCGGCGVTCGDGEECEFGACGGGFPMIECVFGGGLPI